MILQIFEFELQETYLKKYKTLMTDNGAKKRRSHYM